MYNGGESINQRTAQIIRFCGLMIPVILIFYGLLAQQGVISTLHYTNGGVLLAIMLPWTLLAILQFFRHTKSAANSALRLIMYHAFAAAYILFVSGFATPFIAAWILLLLASYAYFSHLGLRLSILTLVVITVVDITLHLDQTTVVLSDTISTLAVLITGLAAIWIGQAKEANSIELSRSKAQENLQRDRILTIVNNLADAVLSTDENGVIRVYNAASLNLLDTNTSLNGQHIDKAITLYDSEDKPLSLFKEFKKSRATSIRDDLTAIIGDETLRLEVTYSPIRSSYSRSKQAETQDGYIIILRDITKAKSLEEERDEFISVVSHELRTPITIAEGTVSNVQLMMERPDIADNILKDGIATAHDQIVYLAKMVNDLSTLSRAERGVADEPEPIDIRELINDIFTEYEPQAKKKKLHLNLDTSPRLGTITASRLYLKELIQNFVTNAIKYTKEGSVTIEVTRKKNMIVFTVKDTGIGISKNDQEKIFNKFYRSEDYRTRETGGTGLGLYVAMKLARKLGTQIELKSRINHGSSFSFTLPVNEK